MTWLCQSLGIPSAPPKHRSHSEFAIFWDNAKKGKMTKVQPKAQLQVIHIVRYLKQSLKIDMNNLRLASYESVIKALCITLTFLTISRSTELLYSDKSDRTDKEALFEFYTGLRWRDICVKERDGFTSPKTMDIRVVWFKNQPNKEIPKVIRFASACCGKDQDDCVCAYFDVQRLALRAKELRMNRHNDFTPFRKSGTGVLGSNQIAYLGTRREDYVFVNSRGTRMGYSQISNIVRDIDKVCSVSTAKLPLTSYSIRIGATSLAHHQDVDPLKVMRFVEWQPGNVTMHAYYINYDEFQLATIPFEMLHGANHLPPDSKRVLLTPVTFELRDEVVRAALYSGSSLKEKTPLKASRPTPRRVTYDD